MINVSDKVLSTLGVFGDLVLFKVKYHFLIALKQLFDENEDLIGFEEDSNYPDRCFALVFQKWKYLSECGYFDNNKREVIIGHQLRDIYNSLLDSIFSSNMIDYIFGDNISRDDIDFEIEVTKKSILQIVSNIKEYTQDILDFEE